MNHQNELSIKEWLLRAQDDELSIKAILNNEAGAPSTACFLSQQMAEKYLKGFLLFQQKEFPKIHELDRLLELCAKVKADFARLRDDCISLNDYYIDTRYPDEYPQFSFEQAKEAFEKALKIKDFVLSKINNSITS